VAAPGTIGTLTRVKKVSIPRVAEALKETARRASGQLERSGVGAS